MIYLPEVTPAPSSSLRQLAYAENMGMAGPDVDPEGWHALPSVTVRGTIFRERSIKLHCTVSLTPLYAPPQLTLSLRTALPRQPCTLLRSTVQAPH